ncbi:hypothetical protein TWF192_006357 [Orbilia oligospora]|uniref:Uncharacterized protein n=1 Tax=Orbilia oligospora TaxID=2813651 RepID=A0A6G1LQ22_ORBOL|nr:hypothetical protein TWF679_003303 [Orbilia oligospora]KAF3227873.1 hypothetical protein TWF192_006357 [Orbilia oligospora]
MPRPPRRVPSKKTTASTARVTKPAAKTVAASTRPSTSGKRKSTDSTRPARKTSVEAAEDNTVKPPALKKRRVARGVVKNARKKKILLEEIDTKWVNLSESSVAELSKLLRDVGRAVLSDMPLKSASKREEAQKTLEKSYQRFERSLAKVKIPPGSSEKVFNNEWLINEEARINALIQPEARQINMLQKELAKQRRLLETEERQLLTLQKNAKAEKEVRRQKALKFIPALKAPPMDPDQLQLEIDKIRLNSDKSESDFTIARDLLKEDEGLLPTMTQLEKHLTSIAKNRQALGAIPEWIQSTRAAVDDVLYNLKGDRYADLMDLSV